ncbi:hypothetical protein OCU04_008151 [Sclerotinia nivalis]|uniref:Uncharacterized protein n=1 Tax=Sclerotinia nivalis TaxID=352851 RepID=A0A9X0AHH2_9HELO|nr:hypothetical protein OCU04_008151 [Sclerotinia nivalis]
MQRSARQFYRLAGLSTQYQNKLAIDYSKDTPEVYKDVARSVIVTTQRLEITCTDEKTECECQQGSHKKSFSLPTWVSNWPACRQAPGSVLLRTPRWCQEG